MTGFFEIDDLSLWLAVLEQVVDSSTNMVVITDAERRIMWVNATYTKITGWTLVECIGKNPKELLHGPDTSQEVIQQMSARLRDGEPVQGAELINYRKNGEAYRVKMDINAIREGGGQIYAYLSIQSDITDRHQLQLDSQELRQRLEAAQRLARLGRVETDAVTGLTYWSSEVFRILGIPPDNEPRDFHDLLEHASGSDVQAFQREIQSCCETGEEIDLELKVEGKRGVRWLRCRGVPQPDGDGFQLPASWSVQDITLYKSSLEERRQLNNRLQSLVIERTKSLEESNKALEDFSYALSHDLRAPLRHMAGFAEILAEELRAGNSDECLRYCDKIGEATKKMQELIEGMLAFAQAGRQGMRVVPILLSSMVREVIAAVERPAPTPAVIWDIDPDLPVIQGDPVLLREVWLNLLDNALKYSSKKQQSHVRVAWTPHDEGWEFMVRDNGVGFDPGHAHKLFGMFQRLHRDDQFKGTGVGLALVRRIVESHGRIWAVSAPDSGASFHFILPFNVGKDRLAGETPPASP